jgi:hypothetical protein
MDLEKCLTDLYRYGFPRVHSSKDGWYVCVEMHVNATGAKFNVASEFGHQSPSSAASECLTRVDAILKGFRDGTNRLEVGK